MYLHGAESLPGLVVDEVLDDVLVPTKRGEHERGAAMHAALVHQAAVQLDPLLHHLCSVWSQDPDMQVRYA